MMKSRCTPLIALAVFGLVGIRSGQAGGLQVPDAKPKEYSVWLVPSGAARDRLKTRIESLSKKYRKDYLTPDFEPHVTLIGLGAVAGQTDDSMAAAVADLVKDLKPYPIRLREIGYTEKYFRSFFLKVEQTPEVMEAGTKGLKFYRKLQKKEPADPKYFPHLSLLYGILPPEKKERIIAKDFGGAREPEPGFIVERVQLWVTNDKPDTWYLVKEFILAPASSKASGS